MDTYTLTTQITGVTLQNDTFFNGDKQIGQEDPDNKGTIKTDDSIVWTIKKDGDPYSGGGRKRYSYKKGGKKYKKNGKKSRRH